MLSGSLSLVSIVEAQKSGNVWYVFLQPLGFLLFFICGVAETNRAPFDLPEAESELVAGFHTEYSGFRFSLFFLAEYANMITVSAMAVTLFWGGWLRPFPNVAALAFLDLIPPVLWFAAKVIVFLYFYLWFRASWPRYRYDQLMKLGWQFLLPLSIANVVVTAVLVVLLGKR
jgi:NADH-quinone oxidoreductase subunit H